VAIVVYATCAAFVALTPDAAATIGGYNMHMEPSKVGRTVTWGGAFIGLGFVTAFVALECFASGSIYNRIAH
jgi:hypothetical protein